jgi:hypothetical protein
MASIRAHAQVEKGTRFLCIDDGDGAPASIDGLTTIPRAARVALADAIADELDLETALLRAAFAGADGGGSRVGAARNTFLLLGCGRIGLMLDDDIHALPVGPVSHRLDELVPLGARPSVLHTPAPLWPGLASALSSKSRRSPSVVSSGYVGDCGSGSPFWYLSSSSSEFWESYDELVMSREVSRVFSRVRDGVGFMSMCGAYDQRDGLLPPFPSRGRASDTVFAALATALSCTIAYAPTVVEHAAEGRRDFTEDDLLLPCKNAGIPTLIGDSVSRHTSDSGAASWVDLSIMLEEWADDPEQLVAHARRLVGMRVEWAFGQLTRFGRSGTARRHAARLAELMGSKPWRRVVPADLLHADLGTSAIGQASTLDDMVERLRQLSELVLAWEAIVSTDAAEHFRQEWMGG